MVLWSAADIICILAGLLFEKCKALEVLHPYINHVLERYKVCPETSARLLSAFNPCQTCAAATDRVGRTLRAALYCAGNASPGRWVRRAGRLRGSGSLGGVLSSERQIPPSPPGPVTGFSGLNSHATENIVTHSEFSGNNCVSGMLRLAANFQTRTCSCELIGGVFVFVFVFCFVCGFVDPGSI